MSSVDLEISSGATLSLLVVEKEHLFRVSLGCSPLRFGLEPRPRGSIRRDGDFVQIVIALTVIKNAQSPVDNTYPMLLTSQHKLATREFHPLVKPHVQNTR